MSYLRHITPGERLAGLPAEAHNAFFDTYKRVFQQGGPANGTGQTSSVRTVSCSVQNDSGAAIDTDFPILKLADVLVNYDDNEQVIHRGVTFSGETPTAATEIGSIAVVQGPIADGVIRSAVLLGPTWCKVNVADASHAFAKPKASNVELASDSTTGAPIIWKESGTGTKYALILLGGGGGGGTPLRWARVTTGITAATNATTWGSGYVKLQDPDTGTLDTGTTAVENMWIGYSWVVDAQVCLDMNFSPPRVVTGTCEAVTTW